MDFNYVKIDNLSKFREAAIEFERTGRYCNYSVGTTAYIKYWKEQENRCLYGYKIGDDYISGYNYFYWNFARIQVVKKYLDINGVEREDRFEAFPDPRDYDKYFFDYVEEAERAGEHAVVLKARGKGYSFKGASMLCRNYFFLRSSKSYAFASNKEFLTSDGILTKAWEIMDFIDSNTAWGKRRQYKNTMEHKRASYQVSVDGIKTERGFRSEIIGVSVDEVGKIRGKRGKLLIYEEAGTFKDLLKAYQISRPSVEAGNKTFGLILVFGTGGEEKLSDAMGLEELFFHPDGYRIHAIPNIWSEGSQGKSGFFVPVWANMDGFYDEITGVSDKAAALKYHDEEYNNVLRNAKDAKSAVRYKAENCVVPEDAVLRVSGSIFPTNFLKQRLSELVSDDKYTDAEYVGELVYSDDKVIFKVNRDKIPIRNFPTGAKDKPEGAIVIWEHPVKNKDDNITSGIYIASTDPLSLAA